MHPTRFIQPFLFEYRDFQGRTHDSPLLTRLITVLTHEFYRPTWRNERPGQQVETDPARHSARHEAKSRAFPRGIHHRWLIVWFGAQWQGWRKMLDMFAHLALCQFINLARCHSLAIY